MTNTKSTPKSCSCSQCKAGKHGGAKDMVKSDERAYRHASKIQLAKGNVFISLAPKGNYYD